MCYILNHFHCIINNSGFKDEVKSFLNNLVSAKHRKQGKKIREDTRKREIGEEH